jgi:diguanylate cyclase (GGDEF)-like protein
MPFIPSLVARKRRFGSLRFLLSVAFVGIAVLILALSGVGMWGMQKLFQPIASFKGNDLPELHTLSALRLDLAALERDDRQVLLDTSIAQVDADAELIPADEASLQADLTVLLGLPLVQQNPATILQLRQAYATWSALQKSFDADLAQRTPARWQTALNLETDNGPFRQQGWVVDGLLAQLQVDEVNEVSNDDVAAHAAATLVIEELLASVCVALALTLGVGWWVTRHIAQVQQELLRTNEELGSSLNEIGLQHEEISAQHEALAASNAELEANLSIRAEIEVELATALEESQRTQQSLTTIYEAVRDGLAVFAPDGTLIYANPAYRHIVDVPTGEPTAADLSAVRQLFTLENEPLPKEMYPTLRVLRGEAPDPPTNYQLCLPDGTQKFVQIEAIPLIDLQGVNCGALNVTRDITNEYRETRHNEILRDLAHACASAPDEATIAQMATRVLMDGFGLAHCGILVRDDEHEGFARPLILQCGNDISAEELALQSERVTTIPISGTAPILALRVLATGEARFHQPFPAPEDDPLHPSPLFAALAHVPITYVPIIIDQRVGGVLIMAYDVHQKSRGSTTDQDLLQAVADELGLAFHRARLYEEARRLALHDPLTGLHNHRALQQILLHELSEAAAQSMPITAIMLDVDHFRQFNERYGHDVGDTALRTVAQAIQSVLRAHDCAARYGGEEFTVILPGIPGDQGMKIAERIRAAIANSHIQVNDVLIGITASLGVASFPLNATNPTGLLKAADIALYEAKHSGRNRVALYEGAFDAEALGTAA